MLEDSRALFREFFDDRYQDSPSFAEDLLFPLLRAGNDLHAVSAFVPSYVYRLFDLLRTTATEDFGLLNITFYVPSDLGIRSKSLSTLVEYFSEYVDFDGQIANFANDGIELAESGAINLNIVYSLSKRKLARGCALVAVEGGGREDYVSMVDSKGGDWNSPLVPARSWVADQQFNAGDVLSQIARFNQIDNPKFKRMPADTTTAILGEAFAVLRQEFAERSVVTPNNVWNMSDEALDEDLDGYEIRSIGSGDASAVNYFEFEFDDDGNVVEVEEVAELSFNDEDLEHIDELLELSDGLRLNVEWSETVNGHAPPFSAYMADYFPLLFATCVCGQVFNRAEGCPSFLEA